MADRVAMLKLRVEGCEDCPFAATQNNLLMCTIVNPWRKTERVLLDSIPDWCPLPLAGDKEEGNKND